MTVGLYEVADAQSALQSMTVGLYEVADAQSVLLLKQATSDDNNTAWSPSLWPSGHSSTRSSSVEA